VKCVNFVRQKVYLFIDLDIHKISLWYV